MPPTGNWSQHLNLLVGIDRKSFNKSREAMRSLERDTSLGVSDAVRKRLAGSMASIISQGEKGASEGLRTRLDREMRGMVEAYATNLSNLRDTSRTYTDSHGNDIRDKLIAAETERVEQEFALLEAQHKERLAGEQKLKQMMSAKGMGSAGSQLADGFMGALQNVKSGDMAGLAKGLIGGVGKAAGGASELLGAAGASASTAGAAAALGTAATALGVAAAGFAVVAGLVAGLVALLVAADKQAKEFNTTLLEGAGIGDFAFSTTGDVAADMEETLQSARVASLKMAVSWRGQAKDYTAMIAQLNQAGVTFKEMAKNGEAQDVALRGWMKTTLVWSKTFGLSTSEMTESIAGLSNELGMSQRAITDQYAEIATMAQLSGMGTKRFFSAVSQATAGMALYNIRMDEAAGLLLMTSKILGGADASEFIKSLTKGFVDESYQDRVKRLMLMGKDAVDNFTASLDTATSDFAKSFGKNEAVKTALANVLGKGVADIDISSSDKFKSVLGGMSAEQTSQLKAALFQASSGGDDAAAAALRQLQTIGELQAASSGDLGAMAKGMGGLSMQAKLAAKMDNFMGKRLGEMTLEERMGFEQTSGISGEQLHQMVRLEDVLWSVYQSQVGTEKAQAGGQAAFLDWVRTDAAAGKLVSDDMKKNAKMTAEEMAKASMESTQSILGILETGIQATLEATYGVLLAFYNWSRKLSPEEVKMQEAAIEANKADQERVKSSQKGLTDSITLMEEAAAEQGRELTDQEIEAKKAMEAAIEKLNGQLGILAIEAKKLPQIGHITATTKTADDMRVEATRAALGTSAGEEAAATALGVTDEEFSARKARAEAAAQQKAVEFMGKESSDMLINPVSHFLSGLNPWGTSTKVKDQMTNVNDAYNDELLGQGDESVDLEKSSLQTLNDEFVETVKSRKTGDKVWKFFKQQFEDVSARAFGTALKEQDARSLAVAMGFSGDDLEKATKDLMGGTNLKDYADEFAKLSKEDAAKAKEFGLGVANDFISRPGQPAQRFSSADTLVGFKDGGPIAKMAGSGSTHITINVNGGDQSQVYQTVKSALKNSGLRP